MKTEFSSFQLILTSLEYVNRPEWFRIIVFVCFVFIKMKCLNTLHFWGSKTLSFKIRSGKYHFVRWIVCAWNELLFFQTYSGTQLTMQTLFLCKAQKKKKKNQNTFYVLYKKYLECVSNVYNTFKISFLKNMCVCPIVLFS